MNVPNKRMTIYIRQKNIEQQGKTDEFTVKVEDINTFPSEIDTCSSQKISKNRVELTPSISRI